MIARPPDRSWSSPRPSLRDCRAASRSVRAARYGRTAVDLLRARSGLGPFWGKGPLSLLLFVAGHEGTLVWRNPDSFALLQPPGNRASAELTGGWSVRLLRGLVRYWPVFMLMLLPGVCFLVALLAAAVLALPGSTMPLLVTAGKLYVAVLMVWFMLSAVASALRWVSRPRPEPETVAEQTLPGIRWTLVLCHDVDGDGDSDSKLLDHVAAQLQRHLAGKAERLLDELRGAAPSLDVTETVVCLQAGVTTDRMREQVTNWSSRAGRHPNAKVLFKDPLRRARRIPRRLFDKGGFAVWYVLGALVTVAVCAMIVADQERAACVGTTCDGRPASYPQALRWLLQRLLFTDPPDLAPATLQMIILGWTTSVMSAMGIVVVFTAGYRFVKYRNQILKGYTAVLNQPGATVLIMVATITERDAIVAAVKAVNGRTPRRRFLDTHVVFDLGPVSRAQVVLAQSGQGAVDPGGAAITAAALISRLDPDYLILAGICYGLREEQQSMGDIVVSRQLRAIDHRKVTEPEPGQPPVTLLRGDFVSSSQSLYQRFQASTFDWSGCRVHFGTMLSSSTLVNSRRLRQELLALDPEAMGGEMEGAGVYAAAAPRKVDWIVVKAISDWGYHKDDAAQPDAAGNAAEFIVHALNDGAMDEPALTAREGAAD